MSRAGLAGVVVLFGVLAGTACGPTEHASASSSVEEVDSVQQRGVAEALELYVEGIVAGESGRIPLASDVVFVEPDGSTESSLEGIQEVAPFLEIRPYFDRSLFEG